MSDQVNRAIAVVGVGHLGKIHAKIYSENPGSELVAVVDADGRIEELLGVRWRDACTRRHLGSRDRHQLHQAASSDHGDRVWLPFGLFPRHGGHERPRNLILDRGAPHDLGYGQWI